MTTYVSKLTLLVIALIVIFLGHSFVQNNNSDYSDDDPTFNRAYWSESIDRTGQVHAYNQFKQKNSNLDFDRQHLASHVFGELLFEKSGVDGISTCDSSFGFGCYHGFFTRAVSENGLAIIKELDKACVDSYTALGTGCQHGLGHGIMEYLGYADIQLALDACKDTTQLTPLLGCSSGVFMEYRTPLFYGEDSVQIKPREFNENNPYDPCERIKEKYKPSCYFELANWWFGVLDGDYQRMGDLCASLKDTQDKKNCYLGVGKTIATREDHNLENTLAYCKSLGLGVAERDCRSGAAWSFFADPEQRHRARSLCDGLSSNDKVICIKNADLTEGLDDRHI